MDSGNSSSMQSSSGGGGEQEEYDSRADQSISALFNNNNNTTTVGQTQLDSLIIANYLNTGWSTDNPLWSTTTTKPTHGSTPPPLFFTNPLEQEDLRLVSNTSSSPISSVPTDKKNGLAATARNPKKRSRVSRRAPTTVLTTDTSNFRAMVQEFTGNPSTPFTGLSSSSSPFPRSRFDLFGSSSSSRPLKPFPHKIIPPPSTTHRYLTPPPTDYHQSHLLNMNMQTIPNPFLNNTSRGLGANFEGLHNIIVSSSSSMTQQEQTLDTMHGLDKTSETDNDLLRSSNGDEEQYMVQRSDGYTPQ